MVCYHGRILCQWEIGEASPEDPVQIDLIRGVGSSSGNVNENEEGDDLEIREDNVVREGSSSEAQKYLIHSDSEPEGDEQQTISGTKVHAEDYGFQHTSSGDFDGDMGFLFGSSG
ncbi:hypothetical protein LIER_24833 [Lithospermum erythrorhizon]|uniref:Uncharacterized protein n=1 Tax=Lithospermum erythrorhizon TaxID=34254 RepID=A0AAV3R2M5_LITER